jgi:hypothetical protein
MQQVHMHALHLITAWALWQQAKPALRMLHHT